MVERVDLTGKSRSEWLGLRESDLTASDVPAALGVHPYKSPLRVYYEKLKYPGLELATVDSGQLRRGRHYEPVVGSIVQEAHPEWRIEKANVYLRDPAIRLGATPDFFIHGDPRGLGVLQAKTCSPDVFEKDWMATDESVPFWIVLQVLTEMMLADAQWGLAVALSITPYDIPICIRTVNRHAAAEKRITDIAQKFWADVEAGNEPGPDYGLDKDLIALLKPTEVPGKIIDLSTDNEAVAAAHQHCDIAAAIRELNAKLDVAKATLMFKIGDAESVTGLPFRITYKTTKNPGYTVQPFESRVLRVWDRRDKE